MPLDSIVAAPVTTGSSTEPKSLRGVAIAAMLALLALQVVLLIAVLRTNNEVTIHMVGHLGIAIFLWGNGVLMTIDKLTDGKRLLDQIADLENG